MRQKIRAKIAKPRSTRTTDRFWMETCRQHLLRYRRSARLKEQTVPLAIPEISSRPFLDGNVSAALVAIPEISPSQRTNRTTCDTREQLATVSGWKRVGSTCDTGDQLVSNLLLYFATADTSEDRETQKHSYNRPFLDGNVSAALVATPEISPSQSTNRTTCDTRDQLVTVSGWKRIGSTCDIGDQLVSNLLYFATADTSEDRETQMHSYNRPFLDGNVSLALAKPDMNHQKKTEI